ncbi:MAG TPA: DUF5681 domain-containing protein [Pseudomonadales bacterium]|nr:DUF5681 domain-containing protein [Pseudomonadales bacterium]
MGRFQPGQSGNPKGRPPKDRALTALLEKAGKKTITNDGRKVARNRVLASKLWELATTGETELDGKKLELAPADWLDVVQFLYKHIDGPPKQNLDVTSGGDALQIILKWPEDANN